jgi:hypothetical protein
MTATRASLALTAELITLAEAPRPFPHARLDPAAADAPEPVPPGGSPAPVPPIRSGPGKQGTRMIKLTAAACCGYTVRTTRKWLDEQGEPLCPARRPHDPARTDPPRGLGRVNAAPRAPPGRRPPAELLHPRDARRQPGDLTKLRDRRRPGPKPARLPRRG